MKSIFFATSNSSHSDDLVFVKTAIKENELKLAEFSFGNYEMSLMTGHDAVILLVPRQEVLFEEDLVEINCGRGQFDQIKYLQSNNVKNVFICINIIDELKLFNVEPENCDVETDDVNDFKLRYGLLKIKGKTAVDLNYYLAKINDKKQIKRWML